MGMRSVRWVRGCGDALLGFGREYKDRASRRRCGLPHEQRRPSRLHTLAHTYTSIHPLTMQSISTRVFALVAIVFVFVASINAAANPQPVLAPVAQHASLDDVVYVCPPSFP